MTTRDNARRIAARTKKTIKTGLCLLAIAFAGMSAAFMFAKTQNTLQSIQIPFQILALIGAYCVIHAFLQLKKGVRCLFCHKPLGYLLYAHEEPPKRFLPGFLLDEIPVRITSCPYCHHSINQNA